MALYGAVGTACSGMDWRCCERSHTRIFGVVDVTQEDMGRLRWLGWPLRHAGSTSRTHLAHVSSICRCGVRCLWQMREGHATHRPSFGRGQPVLELWKGEARMRSSLAVLILALVAGCSSDVDVEGSNSLYMGHSYFRRQAEAMDTFAAAAGVEGHTSETFFRGGYNGSAFAIWDDPVANKTSRIASTRAMSRCWA